MLVSLTRGLVYFCWLFWLLIYWRAGGLVLAEILRALNTPRTRLDAPLLLAITLDSLVVFIAGALVLVKVARPSPALDGLALAGAVLALLGIAGTFYARQSLGPAWTARTTVDAGQALVEAGPYNYIRHPIYSAAIIMYIGLGLTFPVWWNILAVVSILAGYVLKTNDEDRYLLESLRGYPEYIRRVKYRLIPMVW